MRIELSEANERTEGVDVELTRADGRWYAGDYDRDWPTAVEALAAWLEAEGYETGEEVWEATLDAKTTRSAYEARRLLACTVVAVTYDYAEADEANIEQADFELAEVVGQLDPEAWDEGPPMEPGKPDQRDVAEWARRVGLAALGFQTDAI